MRFAVTILLYLQRTWVSQAHNEAMLPTIQRRLQALVQRFRELERSGCLRELRRRKWAKADVARALSQEDRLQTLGLEEVEELYRSLPISQRRRQPFLSNPLQEIRDCLWFLLYEEVTYEIRVWEFLDDMGGYRLQGGDQRLVGALFCTQEPLMYGLINSSVDKGLRKLGLFPRFDRNESQAGRFQKVQEALWQVRSLAGLADFRVNDDFLEALAKGMMEDA